MIKMTNTRNWNQSLAVGQDRVDISRRQKEHVSGDLVMPSVVSLYFLNI